MSPSLARITLPAWCSRHVLRLERMLAADIAGDAGKNFLTSPLTRLTRPAQVEFNGGQARRPAQCRRGCAGPATLLRCNRCFIFLQPDARAREKVHAVGVVPVHVCDDHVSDVFRLERRAGRRA